MMVRNSVFYLAPMPKKLMRKQGIFEGKGKKFIRLIAEDVQSLLPAAKKAGLDLEITASPYAPKDQVGLIIRLDKIVAHPQGYTLSISPKIIEITASTPVGAFYGACTLRQIVRQTMLCKALVARDMKPGETNLNIPCLAIEDFPDYPARGVMLDISRDKVPTMETLYHLVDLLAEWKVNQFQLYTEHTFAYLAHPKVWAKASPMTGEEILALDEYCRARFVELVPNQNSFGHMERWLKHEEYRHLAECPDGFDAPWGPSEFGTVLNPLDRKSIEFLRGLYEELLPHFSSRLFNVGCDETWELGKGKSQSACEKLGTGKVYLDFLLKIYRLAREHGRRIQFWGDIILKHPELINELPRDVIALEWGYEFDHPFAERSIRFAESGVPFYVCPGTSSWNSLVGRTDNAIGNITNAARTGLENRAIGLLNTDWGDNGHWQPLSVSYLGYMVGAMASWNAKIVENKSLAERLSLHAFEDATGKTGRAFYEIGNLYKVFKKRTYNCTIPWQILFSNPTDIGILEGVEISEFDKLEQSLRDITYMAIGDGMTCSDAAIVREEFGQMVRMIQLAADIGKHKLGSPKPKHLADRLVELLSEHEAVWLLRNRPGGLADSEARIKLA